MREELGQPVEHGGLATCEQAIPVAIRVSFAFLALLWLATVWATHAQSQGLGECTVLRTMSEIHGALEGVQNGEGKSLPDTGDMIRRLREIDRIALFDLASEDGGAVISELRFLFARFAEAVQRGGLSAGLAVLESEEYRRASGAYSLFAAKAGCPAGPMETDVNPVAAGPERLSATATLKPNSGVGSASRLEMPLEYLLLAGTVVFAGGAGALYWKWTAAIERRQHRFTCSLAVHVTTKDETQLGTLIDISQGGGKVRFDHPPPPGTKLRLQWDAEWHKASVVWSNNFCSGLRFARPIDPNTIKIIRRMSREHSGDFHHPEAKPDHPGLQHACARPAACARRLPDASV